MRIPVLVSAVLLSFGAGIGAGALTNQAEEPLADRPAASELGLMTVSPPASSAAPSTSPTPTPDDAPGPGSEPGKGDVEVRDDSGLSEADRAAGILESGTPASAGGELLRVPGETEAPGSGELVRVRVEVEEGLPVDGLLFAETVMAILNDERGWGAEGTLTFARVDGDADLRVVLASPTKVDDMCAPLHTEGETSCARNGHAAVNYTRWVEATEEFTSRTQYRQYVINHEVGHLLGKQHVSCPGAGELAPVMQQQTIRVAPCEPNGWPYPGRG